MQLTLTATRQAGPQPEAPLTATLDARGGSIGRHADNDLVLADSTLEVSREHARIEYRDGGFLVTDCSRNGLMVNGVLLGKGNTTTLASGDRLRAGGYEIAVAIDEEKPARARSDRQPVDPFASTPAAPPSPPRPTPASERRDSVAPARHLLAGDAPRDVLDVIEGRDRLGGSQPRETPGRRTERDERGDRTPPHEESLPPLGGPESKAQEGSERAKKRATEPADASAPPRASGPVLPTDWKARADTVEETEEAEPAASDAEFPPAGEPGPAQAVRDAEGVTLWDGGEQTIWDDGEDATGSGSRAEPERRPASHLDSALLSAFLEGLDLNDFEVDEEDAAAMLALAGSVLREAIQGVRRVLIARAKIKDTFRLSVTQLQQLENNPLKFSVGVDETLEKLLEPHPKGYMPPVESVQEVFEDLEIHEIAVITGMRAALEHVLSRFAPQALEERLQSDFLNSVVPMTRKAKLWELFTEHYEEIHREAKDAFDKLYGREFADAYETEIRALKLQRQRNKTPSQRRDPAAQARSRKER